MRFEAAFSVEGSVAAGFEAAFSVEGPISAGFEAALAVEGPVSAGFEAAFAVEGPVAVRFEAAFSVEGPVAAGFEAAFAVEGLVSAGFEAPFFGSFPTRLFVAGSLFPLLESITPILAGGPFSTAVPFLFLDGLLHHPERIVESFQEFLQVVGEKYDRLPVESTHIFVLALNDVEIQIPEPILLHVEEVSPILEIHFRGVQFSAYTHLYLSFSARDSKDFRPLLQGRCVGAFHHGPLPLEQLPLDPPVRAGDVGHHAEHGLGA